MRMDKFTTQFQLALADAQSLAVGRDHQFIEPTHLLQAMLTQDNSSVAPLLQQSGAKMAVLDDELAKALDHLPQVEGAEGQVHVSNDLNRLLNITDKLAQTRGDSFISC